MPLRLLELVGQVVHQPPVEVVAAQMGVPGGGAHLDHAVADVEQADVERPAAQVEHQNRLVPLLVQAVGQRRGGGLVDDPQHLEPGDLPGVLGGGPLGVVEVGRHGDHRLGHPLAERLGRVLGELAQHQRADLLGGVLLAAHVDAGRAAGPFDDVEGDGLRLLGDLVEMPADEALRGVDRALRIEDRLAPGELPDQAFAVFGEGHHGRRGPRPLGVRHDRRLAALPDRDDRVRRAQIDAYRFRHGTLLAQADAGARRPWKYAHTHPLWTESHIMHHIQSYHREHRLASGQKCSPAGTRALARRARRPAAVRR